MKLSKKAGSTSEIWQIFIRDSSSTTGAGLTGLTNASSSLVAYYHRDTDTTATVISLVSMTVGTFTSSGFKEIDATNMPGWYQFCPPNAAIAASAKSVAIHLKGATNMAPLPIEVQLVAVDSDDTVRMGLTALPNAAAEAAGGLYTRGTGAGQINQPANGQVDTNVIKIGGTTQTARDIGASVLLSTGTGTGQLDFTSGVVKANATQFAGTNITSASGIPEVKVASIAAAAITAASIAADAITDAKVASDVTIASVTGAVGSVTSGVTVTTNNDKTGYALAAGGIFIKKNTQLAAFMFLMTDSTNHAPATGLTVTPTRSIDGAAFGACANAVTELSSGIYKITLAAADLNGTVITLRFTAASSDDRFITIVTQT